MLPINPPSGFGAVEGQSNALATSKTVVAVWPTNPFSVPLLVRVVSTTTAVVSVSVRAPAPTAVTDAILVANLPEFICLPAGTRMGVLALSAPGTAYFTPCT